ncbi:MAG TPA: hypothetical protein VF766_03535 [Pyrinomonadaceae bacterium]
MRRYLKCFVVMLCCCVLLVSGCNNRTGTDSSGGADGKEQKVIRASELVTKADAERILKVPVRLEADEISESGSSCFYGGTNVEKGNPSSLSAELAVTSTEDLAKTSFATALKQGERIGSIEPVAAIGDEARLASGSPATLAIYVRKKRMVLTLTAVGNSTAKPSLSDLRRLAMRVVEQF